MAPPVAVYVAAAVVGVAAVYVFKEYVYEPHLAPKFEAWAEEFLERRRAARSRRASAVPVSVSRPRHESTSSGSSHHDNDPQENRSEIHRAPEPNDFLLDEFELEALAAKEVDEWRNEVLRSQERTRDGLRRRTNRPRDGFDSLDTTNTTLDESFTSLTQTPLAYVVSNISSPVTTSTVSLPQTPTRHIRSQSRSTTQGEGSTIFVAPQSPPSYVNEASEILPRTPSPVSAGPTPRRPSDSVGHLDTTSPSPLEIPNTVNHTPAIEAPSHPLPFTPTYQVMIDDSPFGPLLPDTPRSSAEMYGERPFSPITRVMGPSSARGAHPSRANSMNSIRTLGGSGVLRKGSGLANEVVVGNSDDSGNEDNHPLASPSTYTLQNPGPRMNGSVISSLSERYPAPPTPPIIVSPPVSAADVVSVPSSPSSHGSGVMIHVDPAAETLHSPPRLVSQTYPSLPLLQLPRDSLSPGRISGSPSQAPSAISPALSFASFLSPMPVSRAASGSEADEFLSVVSDESDWDVSPVASGSGGGPREAVQDRANNPFLDFEHLTHGIVIEAHGPEHGEGSEDGSDESWGSAKRH